MSCSRFIEHEDEDKSDTLVIIVNGDGTVTVDPLTLERVLSQQSRTAVSVIRFENTNEPDSQTENIPIEKDDKATDNKGKQCRKVNLVIEGYYPSGNAADRNVGTDSVVSSTVRTPPLPTQNSSEFLDLLFEELEIPISQSPTQSNMHAVPGDGGQIGDTLVDAFSVMAPEQLKQVETALHSEKAKQILGDDVTGVLDTLKLNDDSDDWVHLDHCYTNIYGSRKQNQGERLPNVVVQDSDVATMLTIKVGGNDSCCISSQKDADVVAVANTLNEDVETTMPENVQVINVSLPASESNAENVSKKKHVSQGKANAKLVTGNKVVPLKGGISSSSHHMADRSSSFSSVSHKARRKTKEGTSKHEVVVPERIVTEDEVDGVKVFKPTRNDKRSNKTSLSFSKDLSSLKMHPQLIQSKLNFVKKSDSSVQGADVNHQSTEKMVESGAVAKSSQNFEDSSDASSSAVRKDNARKGSITPVKSEIFGPELFSTPDIIRKINAEDGDLSAGAFSRDNQLAVSMDEQTADIEKRMSALENGEAILDQLHLQVELQKEMERITQSDDDKLLSDLENSADEDQVDISASTSASNLLARSRNNSNYESNLDFDLDLDLEDSDNENSPSARRKSDKSENSEKSQGEGECEDDPNKLWCLCNKPHNNRFMICCDACDNWFHGKCVGITKAIGEKMEQDGTEWLCPNCRKEKFAKERESKSKLPALKSTASRLASRHGRSEFGNVAGATPSTNDQSSDRVVKSSALQSTSPMVGGEPTVRRKSLVPNCDKTAASSFCVECKEKEAIPNGVYCGADCIFSYVAKSLHNMNSGQRIPLSEDRRITVIERKSGHRIGGFRAPVVANLNDWLLQNPSYEIDRPSALPTCRPSYASTFAKPIPKKLQSPPFKSKESAKMVAAATTKPTVAAATAAGGVAKATPSRTVPATKSASTDGMTQILMKQFMVKKGVVETTSGSGAVKDQVATAVTSIPLKRDDLKSKDINKQRQIKIIPVQPLPSKPTDEKCATNIKKSLPTNVTTAVATTSVVAGTGDSGGRTSSSSSVTGTGSSNGVVTAHASSSSNKKKKVESSKKAEPKRTETKKKETNDTAPSTMDQDSIRAKTRKGLSEGLVYKMKQSSDIVLTDEEVSALASSVEEEIFLLHNKDTGSKYKMKYRQLLFNIRQPQNTLFRRIALEKTLSPYELVRLTADEMACTELAEWRQREAKHEIDMIKKTELENLQQSKVLVLKTHKGELEIESGALPPCKPDLIVPDLQPEDLPPEKDSGGKKTLPYYFGKEKERAAGGVVSKDEKATSSSEKRKSDDKDATGATKEKHRKHHHDHKDRHKSSKSSRRRRSSEREKHGSGSSSRRDKSSHVRSDKSPAASSSHRSRSVEKTDSSGGGSSEKRSHSRRDSGGDAGQSRSRSRNRKARSRSTSRKRRGDKSDEHKTEHTVAKDEVVDDKITAADVVVVSAEKEERNDSDSDALVKIEHDEITADLLNPFKSVDVDLSDMEPTSTVTIKTPPYGRSPLSDSAAYVWKGTVVMPEIVKFNVVLKQVSGNCESLDDDLHSGDNSAVGRIDCVGRIHPTTVWDYISKVKKSGNKDILVLRFESADTDDQLNYLSFYSYLNTKNRLAVVGNTGPNIKDFYVMPLASHSPIPQVLLPLDGPGFEDSRPHLLLAIVVRSRRRRYHHELHHNPRQHYHHHHHHLQSQQNLAPSSSVLNETAAESEPYVPFASNRLPVQQQPDSFTPPHSPTSVFVQTPRVPVTTTAASINEDDEPYSPKDEEEDENENEIDDDNNDSGKVGSNNVDVDDPNELVDNDDEQEEEHDNNDYDHVEADDADEPYSPSALDEEQCKAISDDYDIDNRSTSHAKQDDSGASSSYANDGDRVEPYSPSEHFFNDIESSEVTLPATLKNLLNRVKNRTSEPSTTILDIDPIVDAYKKNAVDESDEDADDTVFEDKSYNSSRDVISIDDDEDDDDDDGNGDGGDKIDDGDRCDNHDDNGDDDDDGGNHLTRDGQTDSSYESCVSNMDGDGDKDNVGNSSDEPGSSSEMTGVEMEDKSSRRDEVTAAATTAVAAAAVPIGPVPVPVESVEENKLNRDPRRKTAAAVSVESSRNVAMPATVISQPPPPGMEEEFGPLPSMSNNEGTVVMTDATAYNTGMPYAFASPYAAMMAQPPPTQMYLATAAVYSQAAAGLTYATPTSQMYVPPLPPTPVVAIQRTDPSLIPLPVDVPDTKRSCEKRKLQDDKNDESNDDKKGSSSTFKTYKKHKSYDETKSSPTRHRSSSYESHRRGYQREDAESSGGGGNSSSSSSRHGHKYSGSSGSSRSYRDRGGYWKSGSDYSSSSRSHKRYSHSSGDRDRSSSSRRSRYESSKYDHEDRDQESKQKDRDKSGERSKKSESSRRS